MKRSTYALGVAVAGNVLLIATLFAMAGADGDRLLLAGVFSLPLLASLNGLLRARAYTAAWASMMSLFYMAYAMVEYITGTASAGVDFCLGASLMLFTGCAVFARWQARERAPT